MPIIIFLFLILSPFLIETSHAREHIDESYFRGKTTSFSDSILGILENSPALINKTKNPRFSFLSVDVATTKTSINFLSGLKDTIGPGDYDSTFSPLFMGPLGAIGQINLAFDYSGVGAALFFNTDLFAKLNDPIFPSASGILYGQAGGIIGYGHALNDQISVGASTKVSFYKGTQVEIQALDVFRTVNNETVSGGTVDATLNAVFTPKLILKKKSDSVLDEVLKNNTFSLSISNLPLLNTLNSEFVNSGATYSLGLNHTFQLDKKNNANILSAYSQLNIQNAKTIGNFGLSYSPTSGLNLDLGLSGGEVTAGLKANFSIFEIRLGTYSIKYDDFIDERVYTAGLEFAFKN